MVRRQPIHEKDRIDPVKPGAALSVDTGVPARFPAGKRNLACLRTRIGHRVNEKGRPRLTGPEVGLHAQDAA